MKKLTTLLTGCITLAGCEIAPHVRFGDYMMEPRTYNRLIEAAAKYDDLNKTPPTYKLMINALNRIDLNQDNFIHMGEVVIEIEKQKRPIVPFY
jgi:hypothetical protein